MELYKNKSYMKLNLCEDTEIYSGYYKDKYEVDADLLRRLSKNIGFSHELYSTLQDIDPDTADNMIRILSKKSSQSNIILLLDEEECKVIDFSIEQRLPILNSDFIYRVESQVAVCPDVALSEISYNKDSTLSSVIIKKEEPIRIEEKYEGKDPILSEYNVGVLLLNDEVSVTIARLVVYIDGSPVYLPSSFYNTSTSRYKKSTSSSVESLDVLTLKVIDDLCSNILTSKLYEFHYRYRANKDIFTSYEEYNTLLKIMRRIPTIIEDPGVLNSLVEKYDDFEKKYSRIVDQKSSYVWRCTAIGDISIGSLLSITSAILHDLYAPPTEYFDIRDLLGYYISTPRIVEEIAREDL